MKLHVQGLENIPRGSGGILAVNHPSTLDALLIHSLMEKKIFTFTKSDYFENPLLRWYLRIGGGIPVKKG
ncbi:MAG: lysophospholipid acyltransferase family protein, partial [Nitrososphaerales archaeon]